MNVEDLVDSVKHYTPIIPSSFGVFCTSKTEFRKKPAEVTFSGIHENGTVHSVTASGPVVVPCSDPDVKWHEFSGWTLPENDTKTKQNAYIIEDSIYTPVAGKIEFVPVFTSRNIVEKPKTMSSLIASVSNSSKEVDISDLVHDSISDEDMFNLAITRGELKLGLECESSLVINIGKAPGKHGYMWAKLSHGTKDENLNFDYIATYQTGAPPMKDVVYSNTKTIYIPPQDTNLVMQSSGGKLVVRFLGVFYD